MLCALLSVFIRKGSTDNRSNTEKKEDFLYSIEVKRVERETDDKEEEQQVRSSKKRKRKQPIE